MYFLFLNRVYFDTSKLDNSDETKFDPKKWRLQLGPYPAESRKPLGQPMRVFPAWAVQHIMLTSRMFFRVG